MGTPTDSTRAKVVGDADPSLPTERRGLSPIAQFAAKTAIVTLAIVIGGWIILDQIFDRLNSALEHRTEQLRQELSHALKADLVGRGFWGSLQRVLDKAADPRNEPDPEVRRRIFADLRILADRWRPILLEGAAIISSDSASLPARPDAKPTESGTKQP